jgi:hypothetical protein
VRRILKDFVPLKIIFWDGDASAVEKSLTNYNILIEGRK